MFEGKAGAALTNMRAALTARHSVTDIDLAELPARLIRITDAAQARALGISGLDPAMCDLYVTDSERRAVTGHVDCLGSGNLLVLDNARWSGFVDFKLRLGTNCAVVFAGGQSDFIVLEDVFLRGNDQWLYWGDGATSVGTRIEVEGDGCGVAIGDDCMLSSGISIRNYDMHTVFEIETERLINREPRSVVLEQHVWLGDGVLLVNPAVIGFGSVVGARAFVNAPIPHASIAGGVPARVLRAGASWDRQSRGISDATRERLAWLHTMRARG